MGSTFSRRSNTRLIMKTLFKNEAKKARFIPMYADFASPERVFCILIKILSLLFLCQSLFWVWGQICIPHLFSGIKNLGLALSKDAPNVVAVSAQAYLNLESLLEVLNSRKKNICVFWCR